MKKIFLFFIFCILFSSFTYAVTNDYIAWWKGEDNFLDETGVFNGTNSGAIFINGGIDGKRFNFSDVQTSNIVIPENDASLDLLNDDACFSFWLSVREFDDADTIMLKDTGGQGWLVNMRSNAVAECDSGTCMCFTIQGLERECQGTGTVDISSDSLDHWVVVHDSAESVYFYQNGSLVSTEHYSVSRNIPSSTQSAHLGGYGEANYLTGTLDEIKIFNHNCTQADVTALFNEFDVTPSKTNVSCFGDSVTSGSNLPDTPNENFCHLIGENNNYNDYNEGIDGDSCEHLVNRINNVTGKGHNWTIVMCGTNDVKCTNNILTNKTYANLTYVIEQIVLDGQNAIISTIPPINDSSECIPENNQTLVKLRNDVIRRISHDQQVCYVDINTEVFNNTYESDLFLDGYHPNALTHGLMNASYFNTISGTCNIFDCALNKRNCYNYTIDATLILNSDIQNNTGFQELSLYFGYNGTLSGNDIKKDIVNYTFYVNDVLNVTIEDINISENRFHNFSIGSLELPFNISFNVSNVQVHSNRIYAFYSNISVPSVPITTNESDTAQAISELSDSVDNFGLMIFFIFCLIIYILFQITKLRSETVLIIFITLFVALQIKFINISESTYGWICFACWVTGLMDLIGYDND